LTERRGFSLLELLIATALALVLATAVLSVVSVARAVSNAGADTTDLEQRLRAVSEAVSADLATAGSGPATGVLSRPIGAIVPCLLPFVIGPGGDPPGTARADAITVVTSAPRGAAVALAAAFAASAGVAELAVSPGCPTGDPSCGIRAGDVVLLVDGGGQADLFDVKSVTGSAVELQARGPVSGRGFQAGAWLVPVTVASYFLKAGTTADGVQLVSGNGGTSQLPFVDHVVGIEIRMFGDPQPPRLDSPAPPPDRATYGPTPPPPGVDNQRDEWPAGENCTFVMSDGHQQSRLAALDGGTGLVPLPLGLLTDGPWCPDAAAPNRVDADLLRVREVQVTIRLEASSPAVRGADARLFAHPGAARHPWRWVPDRQVTIDVVPRALHVGR
jgi:prepilin-type N-terminal cleavage/methylation domain-containing protein